MDLCFWFGCSGWIVAILIFLYYSDRQSDDD